MIDKSSRTDIAELKNLSLDLPSVELSDFQNTEFYVASTAKSIIIAGQGHIADRAEITGTEIQLGDIKSDLTQLKNGKGGLKRPGIEIEREFRSASEIGQQHKVEIDLLGSAKKNGGFVKIRGKEPLTGKTVELLVKPDQVKPSVVAVYESLPNN